MKGVAKYGNRKTIYNGIQFDSQREAGHYKTLLLRQQAGDIFNLRLQVPYELIPAQYEEYTEQGKRKLLHKRKCVERSLVYIADFVWMEGEKEVVADSKGMLTTEYRIKRKLMLLFHKIKIKEL